MAEKLSRRLVETINEIRQAAHKEDWFGVGVAAGNLRRIADEVAESEASQEPASPASSTSTPDDATIVWKSAIGGSRHVLTVGGECLGRVNFAPYNAPSGSYSVEIVAATPGGGEYALVAQGMASLVDAKKYLLDRLGLPRTNSEGTD